ncbi:hypothetical protein MCOR19_006271 [Pyricularia oryzae]|nr:hypothetical protein MCOR19_006271 [Pyricularia oryzae]
MPSLPTDSHDGHCFVKEHPSATSQDPNVDCNAVACVSIGFDDASDKKWNNPSKLAAHIQTPLHTPKGLWERQAEELAALRGDGRFECSYCKEIGVNEDEYHFANLRALFVHVENDTKSSRPEAKHQLEMHKELKGRDGWGEPGWAEHQGDVRKRIVKEARDYRLKRDLRPFDFNYSEHKEIPVGLPRQTDPETFDLSR